MWSLHFHLESQKYWAKDNRIFNFQKNLERHALSMTIIQMRSYTETFLTTPKFRLDNAPGHWRPDAEGEEFLAFSLVKFQHLLS
jgi:hypothetical protein